MDSSAPAPTNPPKPPNQSKKPHPPRRRHPSKGTDDSNSNQEKKEKGKDRVVRRAKFNANLTPAADAQQVAVPAASSPAKHRRHPKAFRPPPDAGDLTSNLIRELSKPPYLDCLICFSAIHPSQPTWSCSPLIQMQDENSPYCWTTFHLKCIREWSEKSYKEVKAAWEAREEFNKNGEWRCPACQGRRDKLIKGYVCFCGSTHNPNNRMATPHSCGNGCSRPRTSCAHPCPLLCHPGPCPPCKIIMEIPCGCTRQKIVSVRCGENPQVSCAQTCSKILDCGKHRCKQICHLGPCTPCTQKDDLSCWCGKVTGKQFMCGGGDVWLEPVGCDEGTTERMEELRKGFACESVCGKLFDCDKHACTRPCHPPTSSPGHCPMSPDRVTSCPCGKQAISTFPSPPPGEFPARTKCTDLIPTCTSTCLKPHSTCEHSCKAKCHISSSCPPCSVDIVRPCRCGSSTVQLKCGDLYDRDYHSGVAAEKEILCSRPCTAIRLCGKHQCTRICCPLASLAISSKAKGKKKAVVAQLDVEEDLDGLHQCDLVCGKMLSCGTHQCEERDHKGPCKPCLRSSFEELICFCGQTVLEPPVPCGTQIHCSYPCSLPPPPCGHSKVPHTCHFPNISCPPCPFLTSKHCACGKKTIPNIRCALDSDKVFCGTICGKLMPSCGYHRCDRTCHARDCGTCTTMCGKTRKLCLPELHPCTNLCHAPSGCDEDEPCQTRIEVSCECGRIKQAIVCGRSTSNPAGGKGEGEVIKCTSECALKKRNARLAEALGIKTTGAGGGVLADTATYGDEAVAFARNNGKFLTLVEDTLAEFVKSSRTKQVLPSMPMEKRNFVHNLANVYRLDSQMVDQDPHRSVQIIRRIDTRIPNPPLSAYIASKNSTSSSLGRLGVGNLRAGVASGSNSRLEPGLVKPTPRGWTSVVATPVPTPPRTPTPSRATVTPNPAASSGPGRFTSTTTGTSAGGAHTGAHTASTAVDARRPGEGSSNAFATGTGTAEVSQGDVPEDWEDDIET